jgi:hypothetical protein
LVIVFPEYGTVTDTNTVREKYGIHSANEQTPNMTGLGWRLVGSWLVMSPGGGQSEAIIKRAEAMVGWLRACQTRILDCDFYRSTRAKESQSYK